MYLISPFYIKFIYKYPNRAWPSAFVIAFISVAINAYWVGTLFKKGHKMGEASSGYFWNVYVTLWCRISPYIFGMVVALEHRADKEKKIFKNSYVIIEWIAFIYVFGFGFIGIMFPSNESTNITWPLLVFYASIGRALYGLCFAHLIKLIISPAPEDPIPFYRPSNFLRSLFSMSIWVPIANLSYSVYLWHIS